MDERNVWILAAGEDWSGSIPPTSSWLAPFADRDEADAVSTRLEAEGVAQMTEIVEPLTVSELLPSAATA